MTTRAVGTCSRCGGTLTVPTLWAGTTPPIPTCTACGGEYRAEGLPVLPTKPPTRQKAFRDLAKSRRF